MSGGLLLALFRKLAFKWQTVEKTTWVSVLASVKLIHILVESSLIGPGKLVTKELMKRKLRVASKNTGNAF